MAEDATNTNNKLLVTRLMTDQGFKITTIEDLVKDLIKSGPPSQFPYSSTGEPVFKSGQESSPISPAQTSLLPQASKDIKLPPLPTPLKSPSLRPLERPKIQEYQSTIRTLADDLMRLKLGKKVEDVEIQKRILSGEPSTETFFSEKITNKTIFSQGGQAGSEPEKTEEPKSNAYNQFTPKNQDRINIPSESPPIEKGGFNGKIAIGSSNKVLDKIPNYKAILPVGAVALVAIGIYAYYTFFNPNKSTPAPSTTITASGLPETSKVPQVKDLNGILGNIAGITVTISRIGSPSDALYKALDGQLINKKEIKRIKIVESETSQSYNIISLLDRFFVNYPAKLKESLGNDYAILLYGQQETYNSNGQLATVDQAFKKLVLISEVKDPPNMAQILSSWEPNMIDGLTNLLRLDIKSVSTPNFLDNTYKGAKIRYRNFQFPDKTIDYSVLTSANKKSYLIISNSREAIYTIIDKIQ